MNRLFIIILLAFLISCTNVAEQKGSSLLPENSKAIQLQLIDSLGIVDFSIPLRYDTTFSWVHHSDCGKPCDEQKYRFQPKELSLLKESGWIWVEPKDSVDRFTISHTLDYPFHDGDTAKNIIRHKHLKEELMSNPQNPPIIFDTIENINDRYFSIIAMEKSDTVQVKRVLAVTTIKSNLIKFQYELLTRKNDSISKSFIKNSLNLIKTIHISKGI
ncbi:MAG: hypothetical protein J0H76_04140 [Sphingobacteriales bacterium]|nr:hypothetical protein [Sphingobacteriales bacterium]